MSNEAFNRWLENEICLDLSRYGDKALIAKKAWQAALANASETDLLIEVGRRRLAQMEAQPPRHKDAVDLAVSPSCNCSEIDASTKD